MVKKYLGLLIFLFTISYSSYAQYTEVINSNQPGFSDSPYSVGTGVYQFESSLFYRKAKPIPRFSNPSAFGLRFQFRTGLLDEMLEVNLSTALQSDQLTFINIFESSQRKFNFSQFALGAKFLVYKPNYEDKGKEIRSWYKRHSFGWDRWIPHVAVYGGVNIGSFLGRYHKNGGFTPKIGVLLQNELSNNLNVITNFYYDYITGTYPEFSYVITATYNFDNKWSGFAEHQASFKKIEKQSNIGLGLAYLYSNDLQFNSILKTTFQAENTVGIYAGIGASYRLDRHIDPYVELDEYGNPIENIDVESYNKGFFGRVIDKIKGIFKKKNKNKVEIDEELAKNQTNETGKVAGRGRTRQKSVLGEITKDDKKDKKKVIKAEEKASKQQIKALEKQERELQKEEEKLQRELDKEKYLEQKEIEKKERERLKEEEKLQREIQKLEEDIKKDEARKKQEELDEQYRKKLEEENKRKKKEKENNNDE